jgi:hypothetical protein
MKAMKKIFFGLLVLCGNVISAQEVIATAKLDSSEILLGQQVRLELQVRYRADNGRHISIQWPAVGDTISSHVEVISQTLTDTIINKADPFNIIQKRSLLLTSFDSGYWAIPPFRFGIKGDTTAIETEALLLKVNTVAVDTTAAIRDIKAPYGETYTWKDWLQENMKLVIIGAAILLVLIILLIWLIRYLRKPKPVVVPVAPKIPPHITALEKITRLREQKLWQEGKLKQYHSELTDILREYIEARFRIPAQEQTTDEILYGFRNIAIDNESKSMLTEVLVLADLVKFAKENPLPGQNERSMENAQRFIEGTMRENEAPTTAKEK